MLTKRNLQGEKKKNDYHVFLRRFKRLVPLSYTRFVIVTFSFFFLH